MIESPQPARPGLRGILGVGFGVAVIVGGTLGIGILRAPGIVAAQLHAPGYILAAWLAGGAFTLLAAVCMTELGGRVPRAGGFYVYARRAFGETAGFAVGWTDWVAITAAHGYIAIGMGELLGVLVPGLAGSSRLIAIALLAGFAGLQWAGLQVSRRFQEWTTAAKCIAFLALIGAGLGAGLARGGAESSPAPPGPVDTGAAISAFQLIVITFAGWQSALYFTEEDRDPRRNLPRAMIGGVLAVTALYLLVNLALLAVVPVPELARSTLPAAAAAERLIGERGGQVIAILSLLSLPALLNAVMMIGARVLYAMSRDRLVWGRAAEVTDRGAPGPAMMLTVLAAIALVASGTFQRLGGVAACFLMLDCAVCGLAVIVLRRREGAPDGFRAWGYPWTPAIVVAGAAAFVAGVGVGDPDTAVLAAGLLGVGLLGHLLHRRLRR